jgi:hypothetical protein
LSVAGMVLAWRARAALLKGASLFAFGLWIIATTAVHAYFGTLPRVEIMKHSWGFGPLREWGSNRHALPLPRSTPAGGTPVTAPPAGVATAGPFADPDNSAHSLPISVFTSVPGQTGLN